MPGRRQLWSIVGTDFGVRKWRSLDPCGCLGITLSVGVHIFAAWAVARYCLENSLAATVIYFGIYIPMMILALSSLYMAWSTNPGAVPMGARPLQVWRRNESGNLVNVNSNTTNRGTRRCHKCNDNYKPPRAHHDSVTGRCIVKFDHFCPWVGNAVGALNHKFFCLFLFYTASTCLTSLLLLLLRVVHCGYVTVLEGEGKDMEGNSNGHIRRARQLQFDVRSLNGGGGTPEASTAYLYEECHTFYASRMVLALLVCSIVFLVFTCSMGCEQVEAISSGQGKIARLKTRRGGGGNANNANSESAGLQRVTEEFNEMFGGDSPNVSWHWFNPYRNVWFPRNMKKVVLGYDWNDAWDDTAPFQEDDSESHNSHNDNDIGGSAVDSLERGRPGGAALASANETEVPPRQEFELVRRSSSEGPPNTRPTQRKPSPNSCNNRIV